MILRRQVKLLNEAIEALDQRLIAARGNVSKAWQSLSPIELEFAKEEIANCITSRTYYLQNYHCIQPETGTLSVLFPMYDLQWIVEEAIQKERDRTGQSKVIVLKPRQSGGTEYANGVMCHCTFFTPRAYSLTVAQNPEIAAHVQRKINTAWEMLPWWLRPEKQYHSKGEYLEFQRKNELERTFDPGLGSVFVTTHAERESGVAIGKTIRNFHGTEASRWASGEIYTADIEPSMNAPDTMGIIESASLDDQGFFVNMWNEAVESAEPDWIPVFLPVYRAKKFSRPIKQGVAFVLTPEEQAAKDRVLREEGFHITKEFFNWRRVRVQASIKRTGGPHSHYAAYPMTPKEAFQSSGQGAFPRHKLDEQEQTWVENPKWHGEILFQGMHSAGRLILDEVKPGQTLPKRTHTNRLWVWEEPIPGEIYYLGVDTALGNGGNFSAAPVWRAGKSNNPDVQVAEWHGWIPPTDWAKTLYALGMWYNKAELAVEYAAEGMTTANYLFNDLEYPNLYRPRHRDRIGKQMAAYAHWTTSHKTKTLIIAQMAEALLDNSIKIRSQTLLDELRKFRVSSVSESGLMSYSGLDYPDDDAMAGMIGLFCLRETLPELRSPAQADDAAKPTPSRGARASSGPAVIYAIHDEWTRMRGQERDLLKAQALVKLHPGWMIKPLIISRANTAYSVIHHGRGVENEMLRSGMDSRDILPGAVAGWKHRGAQASMETDADEINALVGGEEWGAE